MLNAFLDGTARPCCGAYGAAEGKAGADARTDRPAMRGRSELLDRPPGIDRAGSRPPCLGCAGEPVETFSNWPVAGVESTFDPTSPP